MVNKKIIYLAVGLIIITALSTTIFYKNNITSLITASPACRNDQDCDDRITCTEDICKNPGQLNSFCANKVIKECRDNDGCCPPGCQDRDNDC